VGGKCGSGSIYRPCPDRPRRASLDLLTSRRQVAVGAGEAVFRQPRRYAFCVTTREQAERLLKEMPEEQVPAALDALQEVERYAQTLKVLRKRHPEKSERDLMESLATIKEGDEAIKLIRTRFEGIPSEEIEREAVKAVLEVRAESAG
jgi:hypothetical protein